ncbi:T9SS type A sorting domain-containing protein [Lewinella sp. IMCC34183]|uniref:T9SS type A sorting domain-containing protein n=1 Tax=Lewinella sp. IMCC34183 TaxID=2248762 RepID=UPI000E226579|nr:T9SS type A sorting domain-containing protein [Lewinella sp. IMCC34183]
MNKNYHLLAATLMTVLFISCILNQSLSAQSNPYCPPKTTLGSTVNIWDWRQIQFDLYLTSGGFRRIQSPFRIVNNSLPVNTQYIATALTTIDYEPTNGWELLYKNLGKASLPVDNASFALYNRYTGIIRVLFYVPNANSTFNAASVGARVYKAGEVVEGSQIFSYSSLPISPLETARPSQARSYLQPNHVFESGAWIILDFPTAYDPCVCDHTSGIEFAPTLQSISEISLVLEGTGKSKAIYSKATGSSNDIDIAGRISDGFIGALKRYKDYNEFTSYSFSSPNNQSEGKLKFLSDFAFLPAVGGVLQLLDFFITGKKTSPMLVGYNSNYKFSGDGTTTFKTGDKSTSILTPGSKPTSNLASLIPVYNNPLGVFNLMVRPKIKRYTTQSSYSSAPCQPGVNTKKAYQLDLQTIKYVVNAAAGIQETPLSIQAALRFRSCENYGILSPQLTSNATSPGVYYSPLIDLDCLGDYTVILDQFKGEDYNEQYGECSLETSGSFCGTVDILLLVALKKTNGTAGQEMVLSLVYETDIVDTSTPATGFPANKYKGQTVSQINTSCPQRTILPVDRTYVAYNCRYRYSANFVAKASGGSPEVEDLDNYDPTVLFDADTEQFVAQELYAHPNPATQSTRITLGTKPVDGTWTITDYLGRVVEFSNFSNLNFLDLDVARLPSGVYTVSVYNSHSNATATSRLIKQ